MIRKNGGFTLIELMVVLALVALITGLVALSAQPSAPKQLEREAERLAIWLEAARVQARVQNNPLQARALASGVELWGLTPAGEARPTLRWLYPDTRPEVADTRLLLGPEPILPAQSLGLTSQNQTGLLVRVATSGVGPWQVRR